MAPVAQLESSAIEENRLLAGLDPGDLTLLRAGASELPLAQGALLQEQQAAIEHVYFPLSGIISLVAVMDSGAEMEMAMIGREGAVGTFVGLGGRHAFTRAIVQVRGMALVISATRFQVAVRESERICDMALRYEEGLLAEVQQIAACNALHPLQARLARWILQALDRMDRAHLPLTQDLIARMLGVRRTTLTVVASRLQASGLISCHRGRMVILDRYGLEETACDCYRAIRCRREAARERALSTKLEKPLPQVHAHA